jgi:hypothetical protein
MQKLFQKRASISISVISKRFWEEWQGEKRMLILSSIYNKTIKP